MNDEALLALFREVLDGQRKIPDLLHALSLRADLRAAANLIHEIAVTFSDNVFTVFDLARRAEDAPDLRAAMGDLTPRQIGKLLSRIKGRAIDGLSVHRVDLQAKEGCVWQLVRV